MFMNYQVPVNTTPEGDGDVKIRRASLLPPIMQTYEGHFNWCECIPLSINEIENGLIVLEEKFHDEAREIESLLKTSGMKLISKKTTQAFFQIETKNFYRSKCSIEVARGFLKTCLKNNFLSEDYADGFKYVFDGLDIYVQVKAGWKLSDLNLDSLIEFSKLPSKGKVAIMILRDFFLEDCKRTNVDRHDYMEKMMEIEPYVIKWHFHLYRALRNMRKLKPRPAPYGHERIMPEDPLSLAYVCYCLAEILMTIVDEEKSFIVPYRFGTFAFRASEEIATAIHDKTIKALAIDSKHEEVYLNLSEIHIRLLPERFRKNEIILSCLNRVLKLNPASPKGHHRMGLLHFKMRNHQQAAVHLRRAIKDDHNIHIGAVYGLLQILMSTPLKNSLEINSIFKQYMGNPKLTHVWDKRCLRTLHYLKGCFQFMQENKEDEAITNWIIAHDNGSYKWSYYFLNLPYQCHRFGWPTKKLNLTSVSNTLKHAAYIEQTQFKQVLLDICSEVDDAIRRDSMSPWVVSTAEILLMK